WVPHPSNVATRFARVNGTVSEHRPARISDVSLGGIKLVVGQEFKPGELLTVNLPGGEGRAAHDVLACVVHCQGLGRGEYAVGCNFAQELSDDELAAFGAKKVRPSQPNDGRNWARFSCNLTAQCRVATEENSPPWGGQVLTISANGMGVRGPREVPAGTLLSADLRGGQRSATLTILACVVHVTVQPEGPRVVGCSFIRELSEED